MGKKHGFSFSPSRAIGVQRVKQNIARKTGIPTTRQGRQRKIGRLLGCGTLPISLFIITLVAVILVILW